MKLRDKTPKKPMGLAALSPEKRREIASMGGKAGSPEKRAFYRDRDLAVRAGKLSGEKRRAEKEDGQ